MWEHGIGPQPKASNDDAHAGRAPWDAFMTRILGPRPIDFEEPPVGSDEGQSICELAA